MVVDWIGMKLSHDLIFEWTYIFFIEFNLHKCSGRSKKERIIIHNDANTTMDTNIQHEIMLQFQLQCI